MQDKFIETVASELQQEGYFTEQDPGVPGVQALLYARSLHRIRMGFAKVEDHFLFVDWGNAAFGRLDRLLEIHRRFRPFANQGFRTAHALRFQIPNLAVVAVSPEEFPDEAVRFARTKNLNPWYGGETGQIILVDIGNNQVIFQPPAAPPQRPRPGSFPLTHAVDILQAVCLRAFQVMDNRILKSTRAEGL